MEAPLDLERRRELYQMIVAHPGLHLRELDRRLGIGLGDLRYHLKQLEDAELVTSKEDGYRKTFFPVRGFSYPDAALVGLLRQEGPRKILLVLLERRETGFQDLREALRVSKSTLYFHLDKLVNAAIVVASRVEGRAKYRLVDPNHVAQVLVQYKESFLDAAIDRVVKAWMP